MNTDKLMEYVKSVGFPIVVALGCIWFIIDTQEKLREDYKEREVRMFEQLQGFQTTMNKFNETLTNIDKRLEALEHE